MDISIKKLNKIGNSFQPFDLSFPRFLLGIFILYKGIYFAQHTELLSSILQSYQGLMFDFLIYHYVIIGHIAGGVLILIGLLTRVAVLTQIPILVGAVLANFKLGDTEQLFISIVVLAFLMLYTVLGSGKRSVDYNLKLQL